LIELDDPGLAVQKAIEIVGKAIEYDTKGEYAVSLVFGCSALFYSIRWNPRLCVSC
jgi:hypothetical protein